MSGIRRKRGGKEEEGRERERTEGGSSQIKREVGRNKMRQHNREK